MSNNNNKSDNNNSPNKNSLVVPTQTYNIPNNPTLNPPSLSSNLLTLLSNNPNTTSNSNNNNNNINLNNINNSIYPPKNNSLQNNSLQNNSLQNNSLQNNSLQNNSQTIEKTSSIIEKKNSEDLSNNKNKNIPSEKSNSSQSPSIHHSSSHNSIFSSDSENNEKNNHSRSRNNSLSSSSFIMKNGCCKECMRAFSKNGKSCLCQVPKSERKNTLPEKGCNFCGCHGCNPIDVRKDKRLELKKKLKENKHFNYKNQRLLDSDDEDLKVNEKDIDEWNKKKKNFFEDLKNIFKCDINYMGFGVPIRTQGYILGYQPNSRNYSNKKKYYGGRRNEN